MDEAAIYEVLVGRRVRRDDDRWDVYNASNVLIAEGIVFRAAPGALLTFPCCHKEAEHRPRRLINPIKDAKVKALGGNTRTHGGFAVGHGEQPEQITLPNSAAVTVVGGVVATKTTSPSVIGGAHKIATGACARSRAGVVSISAAAAAYGVPTAATTMYSPVTAIAMARAVSSGGIAGASYTNVRAKGVRNLSDQEIIAAAIRVRLDRR